MTAIVVLMLSSVRGRTCKIWLKRRASGNPIYKLNKLVNFNKNTSKLSLCLLVAKDCIIQAVFARATRTKLTKQNWNIAEVQPRLWFSYYFADVDFSRVSPLPTNFCSSWILEKFANYARPHGAPRFKIFERPRANFAWIRTTFEMHTLNFIRWPSQS